MKEGYQGKHQNGGRKNGGEQGDQPTGNPGHGVSHEHRQLQRIAPRKQGRQPNRLDKLVLGEETPHRLIIEQTRRCSAGCAEEVDLKEYPEKCEKMFHSPSFGVDPILLVNTKNKTGAKFAAPVLFLIN
jgi:hypothetical protein